MQRRTRLRCLQAVLLGAAAWACGGGSKDPGGSHTAAAPVASVNITPSSKTFRAAGDTLRFQASARDAAGTTLSGRSFGWSTANPAIATVDAQGLVRAITGGTTQIKASVDAVEAIATASLDPWTTIAAGGPP